MLIIGLTGGIGSGKSAAAECFRRHGVPILDADEIGRELVAPGQTCLDAIVAEFGPEILLADNTLNRAKLRDVVFNDANKRRRVEAILHPAILAEMQARGRICNAPYAIFVIPLLFETGQDRYVNRTLVIDVAEETQRQRVKTRSSLSDEQISAIFASQWQRTARLAKADDCIRNDGSLTELAEQVAKLHTRYLQMAADCTPP
jgi:dephospho-CoA kinase